MTEKEFHSMLIELIRQGNYGKKTELIELLKRSSITFEKTNEYTRNKWNHFKEYIYITTSPVDMIKLIEHQIYIEEIIEKLYPVGEDYEYELFGIEIKPGKVSTNEYTSQEIYFNDIQNQIIEEIRSAKYIIWIAMAWFTNKVLFDELVKKKNEGLNIQIILDDNSKNRETAFIFEEYFETYRVSIHSLYPNIMHNKFCIIDLNKVIHGTFNWTNAANYNKETISIDENTATAKVFADEFIKLKLKAMS